MKKRPRMSKLKLSIKNNEWLRDLAEENGFMLLRIGPARIDQEDVDGLRAFIRDKFEGNMDWLRISAKRREQPRNMWPSAKSAIVLGMNYGPDHDPIEDLEYKSCGNISVYARGRDYHQLIKGKLKTIASKFTKRTGHEVKVFVDTAPLMEKPLAQKAGLGWQGKHTNLVSREAGSWLFLGIILTDADLRLDVAETDHCGNCQRCLDVCPTEAFPEPYRLDARRCISYLTIEHKGMIPHEFRRKIGNRIFGCDDCLSVCPWNKYARRANEQKLLATEDSTLPKLAKLLELTDVSFRKYFAKTPIRRAGYVRFLRNVLIAAGNSKDQNLVSKVVPFLSNPSSLLRGTAVWALRELLVEIDWLALKSKHYPLEKELIVNQEWEKNFFE